MTEHAAPRKTRAESFLGIHFDLHAGPDCTEMGKNVTPEMVAQILEAVQPDYVQCDCKGHPGYASYPTRVGTPAPGFVRDPLRIWRDVTAARGVALYVHYSGVIDEQAATCRPEWARVDETGERDPRVTSVFGPYVDELLIPQLKELIDGYDIDGAWVDGECWGTQRDWGPAAVRAFCEQTGLPDAPRSPEDPNWVLFSEFCRQGFRRYLAHYVDALHAHRPGFQVASNWAYTDHMPEEPTTGVDFISGDYSLMNSVNAGRYQARCIQGQGKPWDLMAWSFCGPRPERCDSTKSAVQLQQEAAVVLAQGGGFQAYFKQKRDASIYGWQMEVMREVASFCRARQAVCHRAAPVPQVALLYSTAAYYRQVQALFAPYAGELIPLRGALYALLDSQYSVEICMEHHLRGRMDAYPLIVIPEWGYLAPAFREELLDYVRAGGSLLLIGPRAAALFEDELHIELQGEVDQEARRWLAHGGRLAGLRAPVQRAHLLPGARPLGRLYRENDVVGPWDAAASISGCGRGQIAAAYVNLGERYLHARTEVARAFLDDLARRLFPRPMVEVRGSHQVDVTLMRKEGRLAIHLVNTAGPHADGHVYVFDEIPPVGPLEVVVRAEERPTAITAQPDDVDLDFAWADGQARLTLPRLDIHTAMVVT